MLGIGNGRRDVFNTGANVQPFAKSELVADQADDAPVDVAFGLAVAIAEHEPEREPERKPVRVAEWKPEREPVAIADREPDKTSIGWTHCVSKCRAVRVAVDIAYSKPVDLAQREPVDEPVDNPNSRPDGFVVLGGHGRARHRETLAR